MYAPITVEGAMPERDLPPVARQEVEPEERDRVDDDEGELEEMVRAAPERNHAHDEDRGGQGGATVLARERRDAGSWTARAVIVRPSPPRAGRTAPRDGI